MLVFECEEFAVANLEVDAVQRAYPAIALDQTFEPLEFIPDQRSGFECAVAVFDTRLAEAPLG